MVGLRNRELGAMADDATDGGARRLQIVEEADQPQNVADEATLRLGRASYLCDLRHDADQIASGAAPVVELGVVSRWRMKDRVCSLFTCKLYCALSLWLF